MAALRGRAPFPAYSLSVLDYSSASVILHGQLKRLQSSNASGSEDRSVEASEGDRPTHMTQEKIHREVVIIGSGPAGLTAAIYTSRANLRPLLIDANDPEKQLIPGGQLMITTEVENYPGFASGIQGPELMEQFRGQALRFGTEILEANIESVDLKERPFKLQTREGHHVEAETLIIASGASAK